jgi:hypothetical protein
MPDFLSSRWRVGANFSDIDRTAHPPALPVATIQHKDLIKAKNSIVKLLKSLLVPLLNPL